MKLAQVWGERVGERGRVVRVESGEERDQRYVRLEARSSPSEEPAPSL